MGDSAREVLSITGCAILNLDKGRLVSAHRRSGRSPRKNEDTVNTQVGERSRTRRIDIPGYVCMLLHSCEKFGKRASGFRKRSSADSKKVTNWSKVGMKFCKSDGLDRFAEGSNWVTGEFARLQIGGLCRS